MFGTVTQDARYAFRALANNPGFAAVAVLSLALGIGANTAIFSLIDAEMLRTLPVKNPRQLVFLSDPGSAGVSIGIEDGERNLFTNGEFEQLRKRLTAFSDLFASESDPRTVSMSVGSTPPEQVPERLVSGTISRYWARTRRWGVFSPRATPRARSDPVAVIGYGFWQKRFGLDVGVLGRTVTIGKTPFTIIGVAPPRFRGETVGDEADIYLPMMMEPQVKPGRNWLHDGRSVEGREGDVAACCRSSQARRDDGAGAVEREHRLRADGTGEDGAEAAAANEARFGEPEGRDSHGTRCGAGNRVANDSR